MSQQKHRRRLLVVLALALATGALLFLAFGGIGENLVYYWSPSELHANADKAVGATIRLGGLVEKGSVVQEGLNLRFNVTDGESSVPVVAEAIPPAMFREAIGVVVEGTMTPEGVFKTQRLMVKHDNQYKPPHDLDARSMKELMATMQFDEDPHK